MIEQSDAFYLSKEDTNYILKNYFMYIYHPTLSGNLPVQLKHEPNRKRNLISTCCCRNFHLHCQLKLISNSSRLRALSTVFSPRGRGSVILEVKIFHVQKLIWFSISASSFQLDMEILMPAQT